MNWCVCVYVYIVIVIYTILWETCILLKMKLTINYYLSQGLILKVILFEDFYIKKKNSQFWGKNKGGLVFARTRRRKAQLLFMNTFSSSNKWILVSKSLGGVSLLITVLLSFTTDFSFVGKHPRGNTKHFSISKIPIE